MQVRKRRKSKEVKQMGKIKHKKKVVDGLTFDSTTEANYYVYLKEQQMLGNIISFEMQQTFVLQPKYIYFNNEIVTEDDAR